MAMTNIAIADGKTTPQTHTFVPATPQRGDGKGLEPAKWYNKLAAMSSRAWETISTTVYRSSGSDDTRCNLQIVLPVVKVIDGKEVHLGNVRGNITALFPPTLDTDENAKDIFALLKNAVAHAETAKVFSMTPSA